MLTLEEIGAKRKEAWHKFLSAPIAVTVRAPEGGDPVEIRDEVWRGALVAFSQKQGIVPGRTSLHQVKITETTGVITISAELRIHDEV